MSHDNNLDRHDSAGVPRPNQVVRPSLWDGMLPADYKEPDFSTLTPKDGDNERPSELDPDALDVMHASIQYEQVRDKQYPAVQMDQSGMNNHHSRNFTLQMKGLDEQERER